MPERQYPPTTLPEFRPGLVAGWATATEKFRRRHRCFDERFEFGIKAIESATEAADGG
jgi:hypothetical protein